MKKSIAVLLLTGFTCLTAHGCNGSNKLEAYTNYCNKMGGKVEEMPAEFVTATGIVLGDTKSFCTFEIDNGFVVVGLSTFASEKPSIAATWIKSFPEIPSNSPLLKGKFNNPSINFCKNLNGSSISFFVGSGGYSNKKGQSDVCVFGDGSMISGWTLIYIANHREGYELIREKTNSQPLNIKIPGN